MAFMGMVFGTIFLVILIILIFLILTFFVLATVLKINGRKKENRKMKIAGNIFLVFGIIFSIPIIAIIVYFVFHSLFTTITLPNGETKYVRTQYISTMDSYVKTHDKNSITTLEKLLDKNSSLVFYHDVNRESILDDGLEIGNVDIVRIALEHGAIFDNPERYNYMAYVNNSMDSYLSNCICRSITEDDIEIVKLMFENNASTELKRNPGYYSNMFGKAIWAVLYNDETVTDTELKFIQVFVENGLSKDTELLLMEEVPRHYSFSSKYNANVARNKNYNHLMEIIGK